MNWIEFDALWAHLSDDDKKEIKMMDDFWNGYISKKDKVEEMDKEVNKTDYVAKLAGWKSDVDIILSQFVCGNISTKAVLMDALQRLRNRMEMDIYKTRLGDDKND